MIIYMEQTLNLMLQAGYREKVGEILARGIHRNREKAGNYIVLIEK